MDGEILRNDRLKRCFVAARSARESASIASLLRDRGIECFRPEEIVAGGSISDEIFGHVAQADFVAASVRGGITTNVAFELGAAYALHKPILLFSASEADFPTDLRGVYVVRTDPDSVDDTAHDIDRFLRHAGDRVRSAAHETKSETVADFGWARRRAAALHQLRGAERDQALEALVSDLFTRASASVVSAAGVSDSGADIIVWLNDLVFETGGAMIVECKHFGGGTGSVIKNKQDIETRLVKLVASSDSRVGLLVYTHDRPLNRLGVSGSGNVLSLPLEHLIDTLEGGNFTSLVIRHRRRAASDLGMELASD